MFTLKIDLRQHRMLYLLNYLFTFMSTKWTELGTLSKIDLDK